MTNPLLVICGPTATGKTKLGLRLAKLLDGEVVSADSRQVYRHMDIGTGKGKEKVWGYDLVNPDEEFSISHYQKFARKKIEEILKRKRVPILVGGSGLYIKTISDGIETIDISSNKTLRENLADKNVSQLVAILRDVDRGKLDRMNGSDRNNPRRLIRAIEIAGRGSSQSDSGVKKKLRYNTLFIGLTADKEELKKRIEKRVDLRIKNGFEKEVLFLKKQGVWNGAPKMTLGYREWPDVKKWKVEEFKYAKRQMTWFKKDKRIKWFDIGQPDYGKQVEKLTKKWYSEAHAEKN